MLSSRGGSAPDVKGKQPGITNGSGRAGGLLFATQFNQVNPPDVPFPLREAPGQPSAGPDGNRLGALIQMLEWAGQYLP